MKNKNKNENRSKNYIILAVIVLICIGLTMYFCKWYQVLDEEEKQIPVIRGVLPEISNEEEMDHYILENPSSAIYMCTAADTTCRKFESKFKKVVKNNNLEEYIVYLNLSSIDQNEFVNSFNKKYENKKEKLDNNYPAIVLFDDGKLTHILQGSNKKKLTIEKTKTFLEINKVGE